MSHPKGMLLNKSVMKMIDNLSVEKIVIISLIRTMNNNLKNHTKRKIMSEAYNQYFCNRAQRALLQLALNG